MNLDELEKLIKLVEKSDIGEIEITRFGHRIRISKNAGYHSSGTAKADPLNEIKVESMPVIPKEGAEKRPEEKKGETRPKNAIAITSPIVGTFFRAPAPDAQPYVEVGDVIKPGQVVCIVEAMKLMNEIEAEKAGKIVKVCVKNEEPVEYGQELFLLEPL